MTFDIPTDLVPIVSAIASMTVLAFVVLSVSLSVRRDQRRSAK